MAAAVAARRSRGVRRPIAITTQFIAYRVRFGLRWIFASIVSGLPTGIQAWWTNPDQVFVVMMPFVALAVIVGIVYVRRRRAERHPMQGCQMDPSFRALLQLQ